MSNQYQYIGFMQELSHTCTATSANADYHRLMPRPAHSPRSEVGQRLTLLRQAKGLTQKQLASKISVAQQDIAYWERQATTPRGDALPKLAAALDVSIDELLGTRPPRQGIAKPVGKARQLFEAVSKLPRRQQEKIFSILEPFVREHANGHEQKQAA